VVVGIGVFSLIPMNTMSSEVSPFNIKESLKASFFSLEETEKLVLEYSQQYSVEVSKEVIKAVYKYTQGYGIFLPGLIHQISRIMEHVCTCDSKFCKPIEVCTV
jgi:hypothetical protein